jgi:membrane protease YdiL (CAAX protease family)
MDERVGVRPARLDKALIAELLLAGLLLGYGWFSVHRLVLVLLLACMSLWMRGLGWSHLGLRRPPSVRRTVAAGVLAALGILLAARLAILPFAVWATGERVDVSALEPIQGDPRLLLTWLVHAWTLAAFGEEMVYRGYLMRRVADVAGARARGGAWRSWPAARCLAGRTATRGPPGWSRRARSVRCSRCSTFAPGAICGR